MRFAWVRNGVTFAFSLQGVNLDTDGDGVPDNLDSCPDRFGEVIYDGCPTPGTDYDGDGVPNEDDLCPDEFGILAYDGCPTPRPTRSPELDLVLEKATWNAWPVMHAGPRAVLWDFFPHALIKNLGPEIAKNFNVQFLLNGRLTNVHVDSLEPGQLRWIFPQAELSGNTPFTKIQSGEYTLRVICDKDRTIPEYDESNNVYQMPVVLSGD